MASSTDSFRTLTQMLRMWDDDALADLLLVRADLALPAPTGLSDIASRATTRHSVSCAVDALNAFELEVSRRASGFAHGFTPAKLAATFGDQDPVVLADDVAAAVRRLAGLALVWGSDVQLRPVRALASVVFPGSDEANAVTGGGAAAPSPRPPEFRDVKRQPAGLVDKVAAGSAFELVRRIDVLLEHCAVQPVRLRRDGVVASREVREISRLLDVPAALGTLHLQLAEAARLLGIAAAGGVEVLAPTSHSQAWQQQSLAAQWAALVEAWRDALPASGPSWLKRQSLAAFGKPSEGRVLAASQVRAWLLWQRPRQATTIERKTGGALQQATEIGVLGLGAVAAFAPQLDVAILNTYLPVRTDEIVLQADLTAVASGPLTPTAAQELTALADIESRGGATVYRFSTATLQRGLSNGWQPEAILDMLAKRSRTPVPQPLVYLVRDLARHSSAGGGVGPSDGSSSGVGRSGVGRSGVASVVTQPARRGVPRGERPDSTGESGLDRAAALSIVAALRVAETSPASGNDSIVRGSGQAVRLPIDTLREAVETGEVVWFSSVDGRGQAAERLVKAQSVDSGALHAFDAGSGDAVAVPVSRITAAHILRRTT